MTARAQDEPDAALEKAVAALRGIKPGEMTKEQQNQKGKELDEAWRVIAFAGTKGSDRLKEEIAKIDREGVKDDFFKLGAARLMWIKGAMNECQTVADIWNTTDLAVQYEYVFNTAHEAARMQNPRVLPMLRAVLRDDKGAKRAEEHVMWLKWSETVEFIWGAYGPDGLPAMLDVLKTSKDPTELKSAVVLLAKAQYLEALPRIRELAKSGPGDARLFAIEWLGAYGHPQDYEFLVSGLKSEDEEVITAHIRGLTEYEDQRAVPALIPFLESDNEPIRSLATSGLESLTTVDSLEAMQRYSADGKHAKGRKECGRWVEATLKQMKLSWEEYSSKPRAEREEILAKVMDVFEQKYRMQEGDRRLTRKQFHKAAKGWKSEHRITGGKYEWVEDRHVLAAATPEDIGLLLEVRAAVYCRVSDECLEEVEVLEGLVRRLGRSRYRKVIGVCPQVEAAEATQEQPTSGPSR